MSQEVTRTMSESCTRRTIAVTAYPRFLDDDEEIKIKVQKPCSAKAVGLANEVLT